MVKIAVVHKTIYRFNALSVKLPITLYRELEQNLKICLKMQKTLNRKGVLRKRNGTGGAGLPEFRHTEWLQRKFKNHLVWSRRTWWWMKPNNSVFPDGPITPVFHFEINFSFILCHILFIASCFNDKDFSLCNNIPF